MGAQTVSGVNWFDSSLLDLGQLGPAYIQTLFDILPCEAVPHGFNSSLSVL